MNIFLIESIINKIIKGLTKMRKLFLALTMLLLSSLCLAAEKFATNSENIFIPGISINGEKTNTTVTLELESTTFSTIISGFLIFVAGQIFLKMFLEPIQEMKKTIAKIRIYSHRYNYIMQNIDVFEESIKKEISDILSTLSAELVAHGEMIPFHRHIAKYSGLPACDKSTSASKNLIALSNWMQYPKAAERKYGYIIENIQQLQDNLGFKIDPAERYASDVIDALKM